MSANLAEIMTANAASKPDATALKLDDAEVSYAMLDPHLSCSALPDPRGCAAAALSG